MTIFLNILFLAVGMVLLIKGADFFVSGASSVAKRLKVPSMFIGLTIVALGTSLPELSVSVTSAFSNSIDMSVGNIVGSNLLNMLFILGIVACFKPIKLDKSTAKIDLPFLIAITGCLTLFALDTILDSSNSNLISRTESIIFLVLLFLYTYILIFNANRTRKRKIRQAIYLNSQNVIEQTSQEEKVLKIWQIIIYLVFGLGAVVFGGECVSTTAKYLAIQIGMSEALVGLTIVAVGTSLPELVTSVVAAKKGENDLALGNVIGSNIINISLILGLVGIIGQIPISIEILTDVLILFITTICFSIICIKTKSLGKREGIILFCIYIIYVIFTIIRNYCF